MCLPCEAAGNSGNWAARDLYIYKEVGAIFGGNSCREEIFWETFYGWKINHNVLKIMTAGSDGKHCKISKVAVSELQKRADWADWSVLNFGRKKVSHNVQFSLVNCASFSVFCTYIW